MLKDTSGASFRIPPGTGPQPCSGLLCKIPPDRVVVNIGYGLPECLVGPDIPVISAALQPKAKPYFSLCICMAQFFKPCTVIFCQPALCPYGNRLFD